MYYIFETARVDLKIKEAEMDVRKIMNDLVVWLISLAAALTVQLRSCRQSVTHEYIRNVKNTVV